MRKVVSFCLYGDNIKYYAGAEENIRLNKELLPDWETVIYYSPSNFLMDYLDKLKNLGASMIDVSAIPTYSNISYPMFWRYISFIHNDIILVRDLDSRMSKREVEYIDRWINSDSKYLIIRDHPWHSHVPGGLFGVKNLDYKLIDFFKNFVSTNDLGWGIDQEMLSSYISSEDQNKILYFGYDKPETYIRRDDENFFIGIQLDENSKPIIPSATLALDFLKSLNL